MAARALLLSLFVITLWTFTKAQACCPAGGVWSEWTTLPGVTCPTSCGGCTTLPATRKCFSEVDGCPCTGETTKAVPCERSLCFFPKPSCCVGKKSINYNIYNFVCGTENIQKKSADGCCLPKSSTYWNEWGVWMPCAANKQKRFRTCAGEGYKCACSGANEEVKAC